MNTLSLTFREIAHRKVSAIIAVVTIVIALTCVIASMDSMRRFDESTTAQLHSLTQQTDSKLAKLNDDIRRTMKGLGFNVHIYPASQDLSEIYAKGYPTATMPENYTAKLAESPIVTINHLLPQLSRRILWQEKSAEIMLIGVDGQVPISHRDPKKPIMQPVLPGTAVIGSEIATKHNLTLNQPIILNGEKLTVAKIHPQRGTIDDITVWIPLKTAQSLLNLPDRINAILALGCNCTTIDRLGEMRKELTAILPNTQIIEVETKALARAEARNKVREQSNKTRQDIIANREASRNERQNFLRILTPLILTGSLIGLFALFLTNVRERKSEIGTLLTIGIPKSKIFTLFLARALILGIIGAILTLAIAFALNYPAANYLEIYFLAPVLTFIAAWLPTLIAATQDPVESIKS